MRLSINSDKGVFSFYLAELSGDKNDLDQIFRREAGGQK